MAISGKVSAASVGAGVSTVVADIVARHTGFAIPGDVLALVGGAVAAGVTFVCGYLARHVPSGAVQEIEKVVDAVSGGAEAPTLPGI